MKKLVALIALAMGSSLAAAEGWNGGIGYTSIDSTEEGADVTVGALELTLGYEFGSDSKYTSGIDLNLGFGVQEDTVVEQGIPVDIELDNLIALSYVGKYAFSDAVYGSFNFGYADAEVTGSAFGVEVSASESDVIYGVGIGFNMSEASAFELSFRDTGSDLSLQMLSAGFTFDF